MIVTAVSSVFNTVAKSVCNSVIPPVQCFVLCSVLSVFIDLRSAQCAD